MNESVKRWACRIALVGASSLPALLSPHAFPADTPEQGVAKAVSVQGTVEARRAGQTQWQPVKLNDSFRAGDSIRVGERSRADLQLLNQSVLRLNANSSITVEAPKEARTGVVDLVRGAVHFFSRGPNSLEVKTPFTTAGVRGTEFLINLEPKATQLTVFEGTVVATNAAGSLTLSDGQSATAEAGKAPITRIVARPRDAVHWALYYPPVIQDRQAPTYRAQTLLALGAVDEARSDIQRALVTAPNNADALSLQSIMTLVQGDKDGALKIAQGAVDAAPKSATSRIARSYALQAGFDLAGARADVQRAVELDPRSALAWARLAELHSSFGDLDKAMEAAQKAVALEPNLARTQTVLGFAHLTSINTKQARETFEKAIALDSADPLPRLGLGLAKIRDGELEAGSRDIEVAASLDPSNALVRSYLGKVYYEEKRRGLDEREYAVAKKLDPKDPTPWFYDAITKQTTNRPVEALQDLDKARELNDNRSVYRSQLLLDSDAAARAASQARIFSELGFQQRALVEGWEAVSRDPTSFSAHRFLADSYSVLPRHEIARVSELLQSQLLAPVTNTPLQPRLAESNLFLISSGGPGSGSFNEFNPLFNRDGAAVLLSGMAGEQSTAGGDVVVSGIKGRAGFSVGYSQFNTDGFRVNANQDDKIGNAFVQFDFTPQTSLQAEYRQRKNQWGDLQQRFFTNVFSDNLQNTEDRESFRVGARHAFSPGSILIGSLIYQDADATQSSTTPGVPAAIADAKVSSKATGAEFQHLFRSDRFNLRSGIGYFDVDRTDDFTLTLDFGIPCPIPPPPIDTGCVIQSTTKAGTKHGNAYAYGTVSLAKNLNVVLGASYDSINGELDSDDKDQFNPKLGVIWNVTPATTIRAAAFQVLKRTLITDQTLEPTEVAGFNQFYDDINLTESKRYGAAVDHKFSSSVFGGLELSKRDMTVPWTCIFGCAPLGPREADWEETLNRAYAFWAPHRWWALRAEYIFENFKRDPDFTNGVRDLDSHRAPLGVRFFHPSGLGASLTGTYWKQDGEFGEAAVGFQQGSEQFWTVDAALSYRLPRRMGFVAVGATNLTDKEFRYYDIDENNPTIQPKRMAFVRLTLALP
jgi:tetratricopeptide (TPR) repeat protein